jgi:hypothetical protein
MRWLCAALLWTCACQPKYKLVEVEPEPHRAPVDREPPLPLLPDDGRPKRESHHTPVGWNVLRGLNPRTGEVSAELRKLEGGAVEIKGYMVPFSDEDQYVTEFLLVPQAGMCIHLPPPPMNQIVLVESSAGTARVTWSKPVAVSGILEVAQTDSPYGKVSFRLNATHVEVAD